MNKIFYLILFSVILIITGNSCKKLKTPDAVKEREEWISSFKDSVNHYQQIIEISETELNEMNKKIQGMMDEFEYVSNPRQVEGFYLLKGWKDKIPMTKTGIYARLTESNTLELLATLSGGTFNQIKISADGDEIMSNVVKHDQALNYRQNNLNTVCFSGEATDSIAEFIYGYRIYKIKLDFIEGGVEKSFDIPDDQKTMIAKTWELYESQFESRKLEKEIWISSRKIDTYRVIMDKELPTDAEPNDN